MILIPRWVWWWAWWRRSRGETRQHPPPHLCHHHHYPVHHHHHHHHGHYGHHGQGVKGQLAKLARFKRGNRPSLERPLYRTAAHIRGFSSKLENEMASIQQFMLFRLVTKFQPSSVTPLSSCQSFQAIRFKIVPLLVLLYFSPKKLFAILRFVQKVIMIAAGSGIAPFRSFWQERQRQAQVGHGTSPQYQNRYLDLVVWFVKLYQIKYK